MNKIRDKKGSERKWQRLFIIVKSYKSIFYWNL